MLGLKSRGKRAFESFKAFAHNTRRYDKHRPLAGYAMADWLLYAANPVYVEVGQGGASSMRGFGALAYLFMVSACILGGGWGFRLGLTAGDYVLIIMGPILIIGSALPAMMLYISFFAPTDAIVRFDRKRRMAYLWTVKRVIEIPWADLTPVVQGMAASPHLPSRTYRGLYMDYGPDGEPRMTDGVPHVIQIGQASGVEEGALFHLEYVRGYMQDGLQSVPRPRKWLHHRPRWRAMFNFMNLIDEWAMEREKPEGLAPWGGTLFLALGFPLMFPMQVTHWLALRVAPLPKWPKALEAQHASDLAALEAAPDGQQRAPAGARRKPVIRVNGKLLDATTISEQAREERLGLARDGWRDRLAAWVAVPLALASPVVLWGGMWGGVLPFELPLGWLAALSLAMGIAATAVAILSLPKPGEGVVA